MTGNITSFRGEPEIVANNPDQLWRYRSRPVVDMMTLLISDYEQATPHCLGSYSDLEPTAGRMATRTLVVRCLACCRWAVHYVHGF